jgi:hypothetical protein
MTDFTITPARYAKNKVLVQAHSDNGWKTRAARLIEGMGGRYTNRERGYIVSAACAERFQQRYAEGWDASVITKELIAPPQIKQENVKMKDYTIRITEEVAYSLTVRAPSPEEAERLGMQEFLNDPAPALAGVSERRVSVEEAA